MYLIIIIIFQKLAQLIPLTIISIIQVSTRTFSYGSALYIHFRDKELLKKIFGVPMMTQYEAWVPGFFWLPNNGRRATKWLFGHWNPILSVFGGWYFQRNLDCVLDALEQTWTNQGHHGSVFLGGWAYLFTPYPPGHEGNPIGRWYKSIGRRVDLRLLEVFSCRRVGSRKRQEFPLKVTFEFQRFEASQKATQEKFIKFWMRSITDIQIWYNTRAADKNIGWLE